MRNLTLSGIGLDGDEITVSAPTISGAITAFRKAEAEARRIRVATPGVFAEQPALIAAPLDLAEPAKPSPATVAMRRPAPLSAQARAVAYTSRTPVAMPAMSPADRKPNPEHV